MNELPGDLDPSSLGDDCDFPPLLDAIWSKRIGALWCYECHGPREWVSVEFSSELDLKSFLNVVAQHEGDDDPLYRRLGNGPHCEDDDPLYRWLSNGPQCEHDSEQDTW